MSRILCSSISRIIRRILCRNPRPRMAISGLFLLLYGLFRFLVEQVREPDAHLGFIAANWLSMGMVLSMPMIIIGIIFIWVAYAREGKGAK